MDYFVIDTINTWQKKTYRMEIDDLFAEHPNLQQLYAVVVKVLELQQIDHKSMDGYSITNLPWISEQKTSIVFSKLFQETSKRKSFSPALYIVFMVYAYVNNVNDGNWEEVYEKKLACEIGRGLRAFPSFLREWDLREKIKWIFPNSPIMYGPEQDVRDHADIILRYGDSLIRIWSYQSTEKGIQYVIKRLSGDRGMIPSGLHGLFPIDINNPSEAEDVYGWRLYSMEYVKRLCEMFGNRTPEMFALVLGNDNYRFFRDPHLLLK